jgi:hypothetical protein
VKYAAVAVIAVVATVVIVRSGDGCDDLRFVRAEWAEDRERFADCVVERQPFRGLDREALAQRLGPPHERWGRRMHVWWIKTDDLFHMKTEGLLIRLDRRGRAGPARIGPTG